MRSKTCGIKNKNIKNNADVESEKATATRDACAKGANKCYRCGVMAEPRMAFCCYCGAEIGCPAVFTPGKNPRPVSGLALNKLCVPGEVELFRSQNVAYNKGLVASSGTLVITARCVYFMPIELYTYQKPLVIAICDIADVTSHNPVILGCIQITTLSGMAHRFILFIRDIDAVRDLIALIERQRRQLLK